MGYPVRYDLTKPCEMCPFLREFDKGTKRGRCDRGGFSEQRLEEFVRGEFPCHLTADSRSGGFVAKRNGKSQHCAGALIYLEKRERSHQMMRINERIGKYDHTKLDMQADVR